MCPLKSQDVIFSYVHKLAVFSSFLFAMVCLVTATKKSVAGLGRICIPRDFITGSRNGKRTERKGTCRSITILLHYFIWYETHIHQLSISICFQVRIMIVSKKKASKSRIVTDINRKPAKVYQPLQLIK